MKIQDKCVCLLEGMIKNAILRHLVKWKSCVSLIANNGKENVLDLKIINSSNKF